MSLKWTQQGLDDCRRYSQGACYSKYSLLSGNEKNYIKPMKLLKFFSKDIEQLFHED